MVSGAAVKIVPGGKISVPSYCATVGKYAARATAELIDVAEVGVFCSSSTTTVGTPGVLLREDALDAETLSEAGFRV